MRVWRERRKRITKPGCGNTEEETGLLPRNIRSGMNLKARSNSLAGRPEQREGMYFSSQEQRKSKLLGQKSPRNGRTMDGSCSPRAT